MDEKEIYEFLKKIELFNGVSPDEFDIIIKNIEVKTVSPGELLFRENTRRKGIFIIYDGEVELFKKAPSGKEEHLAILGRYDFLGEGSLMEDSPHSTSARTVKETVVLMIETGFFIQRSRSLIQRSLSRYGRKRPLY